MRRPTKRQNRKRNKTRRVRKTRGGFFTGASYLMEQGMSIFKVPPPVAYGNPELLVNPFPYIQSK
jgi:hypothetical protein